MKGAFIVLRKSDANLIEQAKNFKLMPGCSVGVGAMLAVAEMFDNKLANGFGVVYAMGFIKGQKAAKAKRAAK